MERSNRQSVVVMSQGKHTNVTHLVAALQNNECDVITICRLYCVTGNDLNNGRNVATCEKMVQCFAKHRDKLGSLDNEIRVSQLYYCCFLNAISFGEPHIRELLRNPVMNPAWKLSVRELVATSQQTKMSNQLLPQDPDLELV